MKPKWLGVADGVEMKRAKTWTALLLIIVSAAVDWLRTNEYSETGMLVAAASIIIAGVAYLEICEAPP